MISEDEIVEVYNHEYYKAAKKFQIWVGLWPFESTSYKITKRVLVYSSQIMILYSFVRLFFLSM